MSDMHPTPPAPSRSRSLTRTRPSWILAGMRQGPGSRQSRRGQPRGWRVSCWAGGPSGPGGSMSRCTGGQRCEPESMARPSPHRCCLCQSSQAASASLGSSPLVSATLVLCFPRADPGEPQGPAAAPPDPAGQVPQALARLRPAAPREEGAPALDGPPRPRRHAEALLGQVGGPGDQGARAEDGPSGGAAAAWQRSAGGLARGREQEEWAQRQGANPYPPPSTCPLALPNPPGCTLPC